VQGQLCVVVEMHGAVRVVQQDGFDHPRDLFPLADVVQGQPVQLVGRRGSVKATFRIPKQQLLHDGGPDGTRVVHAHIVHGKVARIILGLHTQRVRLDEGLHGVPGILVVEAADAREQVDGEGPIRLPDRDLG